MKNLHVTFTKIILGFAAIIVFIYLAFNSPDEIDLKVSFQKQEITFHKSRTAAEHQAADTLHVK